MTRVAEPNRPWSSFLRVAGRSMRSPSSVSPCTRQWLRQTLVDTSRGTVGARVQDRGMAHGDPHFPPVRADGEHGVTAGAPVAASLSSWTLGDPPFVGQRVLAYDLHARMPALIVSIEGPLIHLVVEAPGDDRPTPVRLPQDQALADAFLRAFDKAVAKPTEMPLPTPLSNHRAGSHARAFGTSLINVPAGPRHHRPDHRPPGSAGT
jgi:hypothetical protein